MRKIIVALDGLSKQEALTLAEQTSDLVWGFKFHELLLRNGPSLIGEFKNFGNVFADLKFHDIPQTVGYEVAALVEQGADFVTVHASGGHAMLSAAVASGHDAVVAITTLTSLSEEEVAHLYGDTLSHTVQKFTEVAKNAGVKNIVCSPLEIKLVRNVYENATIITPGIRASSSNDDQKRTLSATEALESGASYLVIGRPITKAPDPRQALLAILSSLAPSA